MQALLRTVGVRSAEPNGIYDAATSAQVRQWQRAVGLPVTGTVELGQIDFVPHLPGVLDWAEQARAGTTLSPGTVIARILPAEPVFTVTLAQNQTALVAPGASVQLHVGAQPWKARIGTIGRPNQEGAVVATIVPAEGASSICAAECAQIPPAGSAAITAQVIVVPTREGVVVPAAALAVGTDGATAVLTASGTRTPVTVVAAAGGRAVVTGLDAGTSVRVPAEASPRHTP